MSYSKKIKQDKEIKGVILDFSDHSIPSLIILKVARSHVVINSKKEVDFTQKIVYVPIEGEELNKLNINSLNDLKGKSLTYKKSSKGLEVVGINARKKEDPIIDRGVALFILLLVVIISILIG